MSIREADSTDPGPKGRKRDADTAEIEVDVNAPEPPSKKALRKAKRTKLSSGSKSSTEGKVPIQATAREDDPRENIKRSEYGIWIGNLLFNTTKDDLVRFLTTNSAKVINPNQITRVHVPQGPPKFGRAQNKGFAYIDFSDEKSLQIGLGLSESMLGGRRVLIKNAKNFEGRPEQKKDEKHTQPPSKKIFVGNLNFDTTVEDLEAHFGICGPIAHVHMATFEDSGKCKGFAWIEFDQISSAEKAMRGWLEAEDDAKDSFSDSKSSSGRVWVNRIQGRRLRMEYAEDKAIRYEKRYGKNAKKATPKAEEAEEADEIAEVNGEGSLRPVSDRKKARKSKAQGKYSEETVQRLTGAMLEGKGQRTVFE